MGKINMAKIIMAAMPPIENEMQDQLYDYIETNSKQVNKIITLSPMYKTKAEIISVLLTELCSDVCFQIFKENIQ